MDELLNNVLERIKQVITSQNLSDSAFAKKIGAGQSTISNLFQRDSSPKAELITSILNTFGVNGHWLLTGEGSMFLQEKKEIDHIHTENGKIQISGRDDIHLVPVLEQKVSAGIGQEGISPLISEMTVPILDSIIHPYPPQHIRVVEVRGDSMTGASLFDGDFVVFVQGEIRSDGIYVISIGSDIFVKRLEFDPLENKLKIISENDSYDNKVVDADSDLVRIEGKVIGWMHKHPY